MNKYIFVIPSLLISFSLTAIAATVAPIQYTSGVTTAIRVVDNGVDVTNQYSFSSTDVSVIVMSGKTYVVGQIAGQKKIKATHQEASKTEEFIVDVIPGTAVKLVVDSGNLQKDAIGSKLTLPLKVKATDNAGNGVSNIPVTFTTSSSSAVVYPDTISTGPDGIAAVDYTLGNLETNERVTATGPSSLTRVRSVVFTQTATKLAASAPAKLTISVPSSTKVNSVLPSPVSVSIYDANGAVYKTESKLVKVTAHKNSSCSTLASPLSGSLVKNTAEGKADFSDLKSSESGYIYIKADVDGLPSVCSSQIAVQATAVANPEAHVPIFLNYTSIGSSYTSGLTFNPQIKLQLLDDQGKVYNKNVPVIIKAYSDSECKVDAAPALSGVTTVTSSFGNVVYTSLSYSQSKKIYIQASYSPYLSACSPVDVIQDPAKIPASLKFSSFSTTGISNQALSSSPKVSVLNNSNYLISSPSVAISLSAFSDSTCSTPATGVFFSEPATATSVNGTASFSKVSYSTAGIIYIKAQGDNLSTCSPGVTISPPASGSPAKLAITQSPSGQYFLGDAMSSPLKIEVRDFNNTKTSFGSVNVTVSYFSDSACSISLGSPSPQSAATSSGVVSFNVPSPTQPGDYYAKASSGTLTPACSSLMKIKTPCSDVEHLEGGDCVSNVKDCPMDKGIGEMTYLSGSWGSCRLKSCQDGWLPVSNTCVDFNASVVSAAAGDSTIAVSWSKIEAATSYSVYRKEGAGSSFSVVKENESGLGIVDSDVNAGTTYSYYVVGLNDTNMSAQSNVASAMVSVKAPTGLVATPGNSQSGSIVSLSWTPVPSGVTGYNIYRKEGDVSSSNPYIKVNPSPIGSSIYSDGPLLIGATYTYKISGIKVDMTETDYSSETSVTLTIPSPENLIVQEELNPSYGVRVSWQQPANSTGIEGYTIWRKKSTEPAFSHYSTVNSPFEQSFLDRNAYGNETYTYYIKAIAQAYESASSNEVYILVRVPAPSNLMASVGSVGMMGETGINLNWSTPNGPVSGYHVYRKQEGQEYGLSPFVTINVNIGSYSDENAMPGVTYYYYVVSHYNNESNISRPTEEASARVPMNPPYISSVMGAEDSVNGNVMSVSFSGMSTNYGYNIYRKDGESGSYNKVGEILSNPTPIGGQQNFSDYQNIEVGQVYYYKITSINTAGGESEFSNEMSGAISIPSPYGLTGTNLSNVQIRLNWSAPMATIPSSAKYSVFRKLKNGSTYSEVASGIEQSNPTHLDSIVPSNEYLYYVSLKSGNYYSSPSNVITIVGCGNNEVFYNGACVQTTISCTDSSGSGTQTWNGTSYGSCKYSSCNKGLFLTGDACLKEIAEHGIMPGVSDSSSAPSLPIKFNGKTYFYSYVNGVNELYSYNPSTKTYRKAVTLPSGHTHYFTVSSGSPRIWVSPSNDFIYFLYRSGGHNKLGVIDLNDEVTLISGDYTLATNRHAYFQNHLVIVGQIATTSTWGFYAYNHSNKSLFRMNASSVCTGSGGNLTASHDTLYFSCPSASGNEVFRAVSPTATASLVLDVNPGSANSDPSGLVDVNGVLYYNASNPTVGRELYRVINSSSAAVRLTDYAGTGNHLDGSNGDHYIAAGDYLLYAGHMSASNKEFCQIKNTTSVPTCTDLNTSASSSPNNFVRVNNTVFFFANRLNEGQELYRISDVTLGTLPSPDTIAPLITGASGISLGSTVQFAETSNPAWNLPNTYAVLDNTLYIGHTGGRVFRINAGSGQSASEVTLASGSTAISSISHIRSSQNNVYINAGQTGSGVTALYTTNNSSSNYQLRNLFPTDLTNRFGTSSFAFTGFPGVVQIGTYTPSFGEEFIEINEQNNFSFDIINVNRKFETAVFSKEIDHGGFRYFIVKSGGYKLSLVRYNPAEQTPTYSVVTTANVSQYSNRGESMFIETLGTGASQVLYHNVCSGCIQSINSSNVASNISYNGDLFDVAKLNNKIYYGTNASNGTNARVGVIPSAGAAATGVDLADNILGFGQRRVTQFTQVGTSVYFMHYRSADVSPFQYVYRMASDTTVTTIASQAAGNTIDSIVSSGGNLIVIRQLTSCYVSNHTTTTCNSLSPTAIRGTGSQIDNITDLFHKTTISSTDQLLFTSPIVRLTTSGGITSWVSLASSSVDTLQGSFSEILNGNVYYSGRNNTSGEVELYRYQQPTNTLIKMDVVSGSGSSSPTNFTKVGVNHIMFSGLDSSGKRIGYLLNSQTNSFNPIWMSSSIDSLDLTVSVGKPNFGYTLGSEIGYSDTYLSSVEPIDNEAHFIRDNSNNLIPTPWILPSTFRDPNRTYFLSPTSSGFKLMSIRDL